MSILLILLFFEGTILFWTIISPPSTELVTFSYSPCYQLSILAQIVIILLLPGCITQPFKARAIHSSKTHPTVVYFHKGGNLLWYTKWSYFGNPLSLSSSFFLDKILNPTWSYHLLNHSFKFFEFDFFSIELSIMSFLPYSWVTFDK